MRRKGWKVAESTRHGLFSREVARNYGGHGPDGEVQIDGTIDDVLAEIAPGKAGFDIGCGNRWVSRKAIEMFGAIRMDACDIADGFLEIAGGPMQDPGLESRLHVRYGDATALPYQAAIADFALLVNVFCVLPEDGIPKAAREAARVLKPGGELYFSDVFADRRAPAGLGYFDLRFAADGPVAVHLNALGVRLRSRVLGLPFGDQGFFLPAATFARLGGFDPSLPHGEDHALVWAARRAGVPLVAAGAPLYTSARKYAEHGWLRTTVRHVRLTAVQAWHEARRVRGTA